MGDTLKELIDTKLRLTNLWEKFQKSEAEIARLTTALADCEARVKEARREGREQAAKFIEESSNFIENAGGGIRPRSYADIAQAIRNLEDTP